MRMGVVPALSQVEFNTELPVKSMVCAMIWVHSEPPDTLPPVNSMAYLGKYRAPVKLVVEPPLNLFLEVETADLS